MARLVGAGVLLTALCVCALAASGGSVIASRGDRAPRSEHATMDKFILRAMNTAKIPGLSVAVTLRDSVIWANAYGWRDPSQWREKVSLDTIFMMASVSKTFIGTSVMQLRERGLVALDEDINQYLPFAVRNPRHPDVAITLRMLMTHTSSISDENYLGDFTRFYVEGDSPVTLGAFLRGYLLPGGVYYNEESFLGAAPGTEYDYSNVASALAAFVVECVDGKGQTTFAQLNENSVLRPLGFVNSGWHLADIDDTNHTIATPSIFVEDPSDGPGGAAGGEGHFENFCQYGYPDYPDGAMRTSAAHLSSLLGMFANNGSSAGVRVLSPASVEEMCRLQPGVEEEGQGLFLYYFDRPPRRLIGHSGGDAGVATEMMFDLDSRVGVLVLTNGDWTQEGYAEAVEGIENMLLEVFDPLSARDGERVKQWPGNEYAAGSGPREHGRSAWRSDEKLEGDSRMDGVGTKHGLLALGGVPLRHGRRDGARSSRVTLRGAGAGGVRSRGASECIVPSEF
eukprot:TRINITY_DN7702_c0_g1_i1.p1 TRINITY_DN7702_c0_g1~~TRINITY_DN7702_c0_g1_i1.p1  ORF type:complete len:510 (+),score=116.13 TRINITY_DN7702_c0_g1_i1:119-1648(+)